MKRYLGSGLFFSALIGALTLASYVCAADPLDQLALSLKNIAEMKVEEIKKPESVVLPEPIDIETGKKLVRRVFAKSPFVAVAQDPFRTGPFTDKVLNAPLTGALANLKNKIQVLAGKLGIKTVWAIKKGGVEAEKVLELVSDLAKVDISSVQKNKDLVENGLKFAGRVDPVILIELGQFGFEGDEKDPLKVKCGDLGLFLRVVKHVFECAIERVEDYEPQIKKGTKIEGLNQDIDTARKIISNFGATIVKLRGFTNTNKAVADFLENWDALVARWKKLIGDNSVELKKYGVAAELVIDAAVVDKERKWCEFGYEINRGYLGNRMTTINQYVNSYAKPVFISKDGSLPSSDDIGYFKSVKWDLQDILHHINALNVKFSVPWNPQESGVTQHAAAIVRIINEILSNALDSDDNFCPICFDNAFDVKYDIDNNRKDVSSEEALQVIENFMGKVGDITGIEGLWPKNSIVAKARAGVKILQGMRAWRENAQKKYVADPVGGNVDNRTSEQKKSMEELKALWEYNVGGKSYRYIFIMKFGLRSYWTSGCFYYRHVSDEGSKWRNM